MRLMAGNLNTCGDYRIATHGNFGVDIAAWVKKAAFYIGALMRQNLTGHAHHHWLTLLGLGPLQPHKG